MFGVRTPSHFTSLSRLLQIKKDNCIGESGREYSLEELDRLIAEKQNKKALEMSRNAGKVELSLHNTRFGVPDASCPFNEAIAASWRERVWEYICKYDNIHNEPVTRERAKARLFTLRYV